jgi:hypothetical protein
MVARDLRARFQVAENIAHFTTEHETFEIPASNLKHHFAPIWRVTLPRNRTTPTAKKSPVRQEPRPPTTRPSSQKMVARDLRARFQVAENIAHFTTEHETFEIPASNLKHHFAPIWRVTLPRNRTTPTAKKSLVRQEPHPPTNARKTENNLGISIRNEASEPPASSLKPPPYSIQLPYHQR